VCGTRNFMRYHVSISIRLPDSIMKYYRLKFTENQYKNLAQKDQNEHIQFSWFKMVKNLFFWKRFKKEEKTLHTKTSMCEKPYCVCADFIMTTLADSLWRIREIHLQQCTWEINSEKGNFLGLGRTVFWEVLQRNGQ
jgi:hypothetical protein